MEPRFLSSMTSQKFAALWNKYRPALLKLMLASEFEPQRYKMFVHEFKSFDQKRTDFSFTLQVFQGSSLNNIKSSEVAIDLLQVLAGSRKATELMEQSAFEFTMDKHGSLLITRLAQPDQD